MPKTEVYSWRLAPALKAALEEAARDERVSVAALLDRIARHWLAERTATAGHAAAEQARLRAAALRFVGVLRGGDPRRAQEARRRVRQRLAKRHAG